MNPVDVNATWHKGVINVGFRSDVDIDIAENILISMGLAGKTDYIQSGFCPILAIVRVEDNKEDEWISRLTALPEVEFAERVPVRHLMNDTADKLKKRFGIK